MSYSYDLRWRAVRYVEEGGRITVAARLFGVHRQTVQGWVRLARGDGLREARKPGPRGGRKVTETALHSALLARPDAKLKELERVHDLLLSLRTSGDAYEEIPQ